MIHTPAPWHEEVDENGDLWVIQDSDHSVFIGNLEDTCGECHANAALMVAAPDLLAACEKLVAYRDRAGALNFQLEKADDFINEMRVAIAKAKGNTAAPGGE